MTTFTTTLASSPAGGESTLTITFAGLKSEIGAYLGISRTTTDWSAENTADVARILKAGQRQFYEASYRPNPNAPLRTHVWSFLRKRMSLNISSGTATYALPDAFAGFLDPELAFTASKAWPLTLVPMWRVIEKIQAGTSMPTGISQPLLAAVESVTSTLSTTGQRWQIVLWPTPDSSLVVTGQYRLNPDALATDGHYPLGGEAHAQTILESCLAAAEEMMNDQLTIHRERYAELLAQSIQLDSRLHAQEAA